MQVFAQLKMMGTDGLDLVDLWIIVNLLIIHIDVMKLLINQKKLIKNMNFSEILVNVSKVQQMMVLLIVFINLQDVILHNVIQMQILLQLNLHN